MHEKFEVGSFNRFVAISILMPKNWGVTRTWSRSFSINFKDHVRTVPENTCVKFEIRSCNRFEAIYKHLTPQLYD